MIYLDNAATTKIAPAVLEEMMPYLTEDFGNPGSIYWLGRRAYNAVSLARERVAGFLHADPAQIIFTSGGTESNNLAIISAASQMKIRGPKAITSKTEHSSVLNVFRQIPAMGIYTQFLFPDSDGSVSIRTIESAMENEDVGFVCLMKVNNETGAENPVEEIGKLCASKDILFHTDCVQAAACQRIDVSELGCTTLSISSHKLHGPKGVGALYAKDPQKLTPLIFGGSEQEFGIRGGTENVAGIVGFGKACELMQLSLHETEVLTSTCKQKFFTVLQSRLNDAGLGDILHVNGAPAIHRGKILNVRFDGVDAETLILMLDVRGIYVSAGSACTSLEAVPSHVLTAMGLSDEQARSSVRISFSGMNTQEEAELAAVIFSECVVTLLR